MTCSTFEHCSNHSRNFFCKCFFIKWPPVAILDVQKSLCILPFQINTTIFIFVKFFYKMGAGGHFGCPQITFGRISGHFRSIRNFFVFIFYKLAAVGHFGCSKFTLDHFFGYFRSIQIFDFFYIFFTKWLPVAILDVRK